MGKRLKMNEDFSNFNEFDEERRRKFNRLGLTISQLANAERGKSKKKKKKKKKQE